MIKLASLTRNRCASDDHGEIAHSGKWRILVFGNDGSCDRGIFLFDTRKACADYIMVAEQELRFGIVDRIAGERLKFTKETYGWAMPYPEADK